MMLGHRFGRDERDDLDLVGGGHRSEASDVRQAEGVGHRVGHPSGHGVEVAVRHDDGDSGTEQASGPPCRAAVGHQPRRRAEQQRVVGDDEVDGFGLETLGDRLGDLVDDGRRAHWGRRVADLQADGVPCGGPLRVGAGGEAADELGDVHGYSVLDTAGIDPAGIDPGDAALDGGDQLGPEVGGGDDPVHRSDGLGPLDAVDRVELGGDLAELLGAHEIEGPGEIGAAQVGLLLGRRSQGAFEILHPFVGPCSLVDLDG